MRQIRAAKLLFIAIVGSLAGCATNTSLTGARSPGAVPKRCFWPPPHSTSLWITRATPTPGAPSLAQVGGDLAVTLRRRGYVRQRWFPVGAGFVHGFAVATRLEHKLRSKKLEATHVGATRRPSRAARSELKFSKLAFSLQ